MSEKDQPEVFQADWTEEQVEALFADLQQAATIRRILVRSRSPGSRPAGSVATLEQAHEVWDDDLTEAIQIEYEYQGKVWCDTLLPGPDAIRIVRCALPADCGR